MLRRCILLAQAALALGAAAWGQSYSFTPDILAPTTEETFGIGVGGEAGYSLDASLTHRILLDFSYSSEYFGFVAATSFLKDGAYPPEGANFPDGTLFNSYFIMDQGGMVFRGLGMAVQVGRFDHGDVIDSPYSLFVSSKRNPAIIGNFRYENEFAFYETRWLELNHNSTAYTPAFYYKAPTTEDPTTGAGPFPDRGAQLKTYGIKLGAMRFGFQDASVYVGRSFDLEYLVSPMPGFLIQHVKSTPGRPWSSGSNENNIIGAFWDWKPIDQLYLSAQAFVDDLNVGRLGGTPLNPWKAAYSLGGWFDTDYGRFGLHHALATKYCFSTTYDTVSGSYGWTYYPDTRFTYGTEDYRAIPSEDLMIGYYNGENNIALRLDYVGGVAGFDCSGNVEFKLTGAQSPCNAWHEYAWYPSPGTKLLDYSLTEKKVSFSGQISRELGDFVGFLNLSAAFAMNALELQRPLSSDEGTKSINNEVWIWRPGTESKFTASISLGIRYNIPVMKALGD